MIQSKSPWESGGVAEFYALARELAQAGGDVTLFLGQNGGMATRAGAQGAGRDGLVGGNVRVLADEFSLRERAIDLGALKSGVTPSEIDIVVDLLAGGAKAMWH